MVDTTIENQDHTECAVQKGGFFGIIREFNRIQGSSA